MSLNVGTLFASLRLDLTDFNRALQGVQRQMRDVGNQLAGVGSTLTTSVTLPITAIGTAAVMTMTKFDDSMRKVQAVSGATGEEFEDLRKLAKDLGSTTAWSASEAADGMAFLGQAGFDVNEIMEAMPGMLSLASAGQLDLARAADIASNVLSGFGLPATEAGKVSDVLAKAAASSNVSVEQLGETMKFAAPVAKSFGMSLEEAAAITGKMGDAGIQGSMAGTALRAALVRLSDPPREAAEALAELGIQVSDTAGNMLPVGDIVGQMEKQFAGLSESERLAAASTIFGQEAMSGWLAVIDAGSENLNALTGELESSSGAAKNMADTMEGGIGGAFRGFSSALEGLILSFEGALIPIVQKATVFLTELARGFSSLDQDTQMVVLIVGALAAAIGPLLLVIGMLTTAIGAISAPVAIAVAALAGIIAILGTAYTKVEWFREAVNNGFTSIQQIVTTVMTVVASFIQEKLAYIQQFWEENGQMITQAVQNAFSLIKGVIEFVMPFIKFLIEGVWENIKGIFDGALNIILGLVQAFGALFTGNWSALWEATKQILSGGIELIWNLIQIGFLGRIFGVLKLFGSKSVDLIKKMWESIVGVFKNAFNPIFNALEHIRVSLYVWFDDLVKAGVNWGKNLISGFVDGIKSMASTAADAARNVVDNVKGFLGFNSPAKKGPGRYIEHWGANMIDGFLDGTKSMIPSVQSTLSDVVGSMNVSPTMSTLSGSGGGTSNNININVTASGSGAQSIAQEIRRELSIELRRMAVI
jgi:TP901 family phage tail tape measure protein